MTRARADIGFDDDLDGFDPADWAVGAPPPRRPETGTAQRAAEATGFRSREARAAVPQAVPQTPAAPLRGSRFMARNSSSRTSRVLKPSASV
ncbi:hypothetical protein, partial [Puniceibacterium confluentis]|uniref:hypothetical protein n=1 Tax=Puniceibacterium confluentis TaxID=1958944 RepID=UPI001C985281